MRVEAWLFVAGVFFFIPVGVVYGLLTDGEAVGMTALLLVGGLVGMIGGYLMLLSRRIGPRPEDDANADIAEGAGDQGVYSPWSWWPLVLGAAAAVAFAGLAIGWWLVFLGAGLGVIALVGWAFEYSRGQHAH